MFKNSTESSMSETYSPAYSHIHTVEVEQKVKKALPEEQE